MSIAKPKFGEIFRWGPDKNETIMFLRLIPKTEKFHRAWAGLVLETGEVDEFRDLLDFEGGECWQQVPRPSEVHP